jgi:hypothetical protein
MLLTLLLTLPLAAHCAMTKISFSSSIDPKLEPFPILPSYHQHTDKPRWLPSIHHIIKLHVLTYTLMQKTLNDQNDTDEATQSVHLSNTLWQVFVPGSMVSYIGVEEGVALDEISAEAWKPLKHKDIMFKYSQMDPPDSPKKPYEFRRPHGMKTSYLMHELKSDTQTFTILHLPNCEPILNANMIRMITRNFHVGLFNGTPIELRLVRPIVSDDVVRINDLARNLPFPGGFPTGLTPQDDGNMISVEKQIKMGFIPVLSSYMHGATGLSITLYTQLLQRIIAVGIQSMVRLQFGGEWKEKIAIKKQLQHFLQRILPGCTVEQTRFSTNKPPMSPFFNIHNNMPFLSGFVLDCRECSGEIMDVLSEEINKSGWKPSGSPQYCALVLRFGTPPTPSMTIDNFLWFRRYAFPNIVQLKPRRFASISTDIYNNALSKLNLDKNIYLGKQNFESIMTECLTLYALGYDHFSTLPASKVNLALPGRETELLGVEVMDINITELSRYLVRQRVVYPAYTILAYGENAFYTIAVPFVLIQEELEMGGVTSKLVIMRHVDEVPNDAINYGIFFKVPYK